MSVAKRLYITTFTPNGEDELGKVCPQCNKFLEASSFNSRRGKRNNIQGMIRNSACLKCEGKTSRIRSSRVNTILQDEVKILQHENLVLRSRLQEESESNAGLQALVTAIMTQNVSLSNRIDSLEKLVNEIKNRP